MSPEIAIFASNHTSYVAVAKKSEEAAKSTNFSVMSHTHI